MKADPVRWRAHLDKHAAYCRARYKTNPDFKAKTKASIEASKRKRMADPVKHAQDLARLRVWARARKGPKVWLSNSLTGCRNRSAKRGIPCAIAAEDVALPNLCPVLGVVLAYAGGVNDPCAATLDRLRPELGYVKGNVTVISRRANAMKNDGTLDEHRRLVAWMEAQLEEATP